MTNGAKEWRVMLPDVVSTRKRPRELRIVEDPQRGVFVFVVGRAGDTPVARIGNELGQVIIRTYCGDDVTVGYVQE